MDFTADHYFEAKALDLTKAGRQFVDKGVFQWQ
jgi:hypothetical protein